MENIFISHIHEESPLAKVFKEELEATSVGQWKVFVSSDTGSVTLGDQWFSKLDNALAAHRLLLVLCSPASLSRLWIGYEVGYAAAKSVPIIPICHSGATPSSLPPFLSRYQGVELEAEDFVKQLFEAIQKHVPLPREPRISAQEITSKIKAAIAEAGVKLTPLQAVKAIYDSAEIESEDCAKILQLLARTNKGSSTLSQVTSLTKIPSVRVQHCFDILRKHNFIKTYSNMANGINCDLTATGREYVVQKRWT